MASHAESALKKAVEGKSDRTTTQTGNYEVNMVYNWNESLYLDMYYLDARRNRHHLLSYKMRMHPKKGTLQEVSNDYPEQTRAFKKALKALKYPISK